MTQRDDKGRFIKGHDGYKAWEGKTFSDAHKNKLAEAKRGKVREDSNPWKGDRAKYSGKHRDLYRNLGQPDTCEHCGKSGLTGHQIHWANKDHKYNRELDQWLRLCAKCHKAYDRKEMKTYA